LADFMFGLFKKKRRVDERREPSIRFLCEQDGPAERQLKGVLSEQFATAGLVRRAYLARVDYGVPDAYEVALCVRGEAAPSVLQTVAESFAAIFGRDAHLDILMLSEAQETDLKKVCRPFFQFPSV
jgi:hypothetical protein